MKITKKHASFGLALILAGAAVMLYFAYYLYEIKQTQLIEAGKSASLFSTILLSTFSGALFALLTGIGFSIRSVETETNFRLSNLFSNKSFIIWLALSVVLFTVVGIIWRGQI